MEGVKPVELAHDGRWRDARGWVGYVWWHEAPGLQHVEWVAAERLRPADGEV